VVIACRVMRAELEAARGDDSSVEVIFLEQSLHRQPQELFQRLQQAIDQAATWAGELVLGYGLCAGGVAGLVAPRQGLVIPRVHDCISLFLGSRRAYEQAFARRAGTYYLTPGWVAEGKDPLGVLEEDYVPRVGRESAVWALREELKNYTHVAFIDTGVGDAEALRGRAEENASFLDKKCVEVRGALDLFRALLHGDLQGDQFVRVAPGERVELEDFL
jgi:hypothetical protein